MLSFVLTAPGSCAASGEAAATIQAESAEVGSVVVEETKVEESRVERLSRD